MTKMRKLNVSEVEGNQNSIFPPGTVWIDQHNSLRISDGETEGGLPAASSSTSTGDVTFSGVQVIGLNNSLILKAETGGTYGVEIYNSGDNDTHLRPVDTAKGIALGFGYGSGQSHVRVEGSGGQYGAGNGDKVVIYADNGTSTAQWIFNNDGYITLPTGGTLGAEGMGWTGLSNGVAQTPVSVVYKTNSGSLQSAITLNGGDNINGEGSVIIDLYNATTSSGYQWIFNSNGGLTFPDNSVQTSAYNVGEIVIELDGITTAFTLTNVKTLLSVTVAVGYLTGDPFTVTLPAGIPGQRLVIRNNSTLCTGTIDGSITLDPDSTIELIFTSVDNAWILI